MDWTDRIARRLIRRAAKRAPDALAERLEEEWLADLADRRGHMSRLCFAMGCAWATNIITQDRKLGLLPAAASPAIEAGFGSRVSLPPAWRRPIAFVLVACLHVTVFYAFIKGLDPAFRAAHPTIFQTVPLPAVVKERLQPPPQPVSSSKIVLSQPEIPTFNVDDHDQVAVDASPDEPKVIPRVADAPPSLPTTHVATHIAGGPGNGFPIPDDFYPSAAIHMGETGAATVKVCVDAKGRLTSAPSIEDSTGSSRLDGAALNLARAGSGHYRPSTDDGRPVDSCYAFRVRFNLKN